MWRSILTALATARAASAAKHVAKDAAYGTVALGLILVSLCFVAIAAFFALSQSLGSAGAAAVVAAGTAVFSGIILLWVRTRQQSGSSDEGDLLDMTGLSALKEVDPRHLNDAVKIARREIRKAGPAKVALIAFGVGMLLARR